MCDDLNIAGAIGVLSEAVSAYAVDAPPMICDGPSTLADEFQALQSMNSMLGVIDLDDEICTENLDVPKIESLIEERLAARSSNEWNRADEIRDELCAMGIEIKDGPEGTTWTRVVQ
jgi:cysteinyl-tRNA synthetase